jgi:putative oxidoreductase
MILTGITKFREAGLLILRIGIGASFMAHGIPKLMGGPDKWAGVGKAMSNIGITFYPEAWGLMAALSETLGGLLLIIGLLFRPACLVLLFTMFIAGLMHLKAGDPFTKWSHALEAGILFFALLFIGPGKYSIDKK